MPSGPRKFVLQLWAGHHSVVVAAVVDFVVAAVVVVVVSVAVVVLDGAVDGDWLSGRWCCGWCRSVVGQSIAGHCWLSGVITPSCS